MFINTSLKDLFAPNKHLPTVIIQLANYHRHDLTINPKNIVCIWILSIHSFLRLSCNLSKARIVILDFQKCELQQSHLTQQ